MVTFEEEKPNLLLAYLHSAVGVILDGKKSILLVNLYGTGNLQITILVILQEA